MGWLFRLYFRSEHERTKFFTDLRDKEGIAMTTISIPIPKTLTLRECMKKRLEEEARQRAAMEAHKEALKEKVRELKEKHRGAARLRQARYRSNLGKRGLRRITVVIDIELLADLDAYAALAHISRGEALSEVLGGAFGKVSSLRR